MSDTFEIIFVIVGFALIITLVFSIGYIGMYIYEKKHIDLTITKLNRLKEEELLTNETLQVMIQELDL